MGRYTRGKTTIHLFFQNDHMISLTTTITISPQKLKQQVVYWLHLASVMRWIPCPITPKADTSCMFKKQRENAVHRVGHLSLCFMERNKTMMRLPWKCLAADFWNFFLLWLIFSILLGPSFLHCYCYNIYCYCTIFTAYPEHLSEVENYYYTCSINGERRVRQPEVHLL